MAVGQVSDSERSHLSAQISGEPVSRPLSRTRVRWGLPKQLRTARQSRPMHLLCYPFFESSSQAGGSQPVTIRTDVEKRSSKRCNRGWIVIKLGFPFPFVGQLDNEQNHEAIKAAYNDVETGFRDRVAEPRARSPVINSIATRYLSPSSSAKAGQLFEPWNSPRAPLGRCPKSPSTNSV
jgi:hypothetical protein